MRIDIQCACQGKKIPENRLFKIWASKAIINDKIDRELTIRIVGMEESKSLNEQWRKKSGPTNVLSFPYDGDEQLAPGLLGDIVICAPVVEREAKEQKKPIEAHWAHMVIHGILHLQGYDHTNVDEANEMEALEIKLLQSLGYNNPYLEINTL